ncbi:MAG: transposase [Oscillospiraceae bacterium]|nr:transposase [Oscillospiraceae bacterium]
METEERIYEDDYSKTFADQNEFLEFLQERENHSAWERYEAKELEFCAMNDADYMFSAEDNVYTNTYKNTGMFLKVSGGEDYYPVRTCAFKSIYDRARISGSALSKVGKPALAQILNYCIKTANGTALLRHSEDKISAVHGGDESDYSPLPMPELFRMTADYLDVTFPGYTEDGQDLPGYTFVSGFYDHSMTTALWDLAKQDRLLETYREALLNHGMTVKPMKPALRLASSDVGISGANLFPMLMYDGSRSNTERRSVTLGNPLRLEHKDRATLGNFRDRLKMIFSQYARAISGLTHLLDIEIRNPVNCMLCVMKNIGMTKKLAFEAVDLFKAQYGEEPCTAHNIYFGISKAAFIVQCDGADGSKIMQVEEKIARVLTVRWHDCDIPGDFRW